MWEFEHVSFEEAERRRARYEPLTASVRALIDASIRTGADDELAAAAAVENDAVAARLREQQDDGLRGTSILPDGQGVGWGNMVEGLRNPLAPPLLVELDEGDRGHMDMDLGAPYEGAPGHLHGGYCALVLDHLFGGVASYGRPGTVAATGTITLRYQRPTRLGRLRAEGEITGTEGRKIFLSGQLSDADGVTVTAEAVFIALSR
jgi:acyl-coenzyme A thioesterase PaaI-like protein